MNKLTKLLFLILLVLISIPAFSIDFPLPEKNYVPAKMPMHPVYPRSDTETQEHARHRWAHPDFRYEIPIGVQGGAWPFKYEIISGPPGSTIGQMYGDKNYGVVTWIPTASSGKVTFTIRVTDQELNTIDLSWSTTIDASQFLFIQDGWTGAKKGTISEPLEDVSDWYLDSDSDSTYANKIIVFRDGLYKLQGDPSKNNNVSINSGIKTPSLIGYPNEVPRIDCSSSRIFTRNGSSLKDIYIAGIRWEHARQDVPNAHFFWLTGNTQRDTFWKNYFYDMGPGTVGNDNTNAVFVSETSTLKEHFLFKHNTLDSITNGVGNNSGYFDLYIVNYVLMEENTAKNCITGHGFWAKDTTNFITIRGNNAYENNRGAQIVVGMASDAQFGAPHDYEICWNRVVLPTGNSNQLLMQFSTENLWPGQHYNEYIYRNTFVNGRTEIRFVGAEKIEADANVIVSDALKRWDTSIMTTVIPNLTGGESAGITDSAGTLIGEYRAKYLGRVGHEVSSEYVTTPKEPILNVK
ncbi:MAG: hypothetical protein P8179_19310 [Candidatus Thiodiazotropha sp.]